METPKNFPGLTRRDIFALEFAKKFIDHDFERPLATAVEWADVLIEKLDAAGKPIASVSNISKTSTHTCDNPDCEGSKS